MECSSSFPKGCLKARVDWYAESSFLEGSFVRCALVWSGGGVQIRQCTSGLGLKDVAQHSVELGGAQINNLGLREVGPMIGTNALSLFCSCGFS